MKIGPRYEGQAGAAPAPGELGLRTWELLPLFMTSLTRSTRGPCAAACILSSLVRNPSTGNTECSLWEDRALKLGIYQCGKSAVQQKVIARLLPFELMAHKVILLE